MLKRIGRQLLVPEYVYKYEITKNPAADHLSQSVKKKQIQSLPSCPSIQMTEFLNRYPSLGRGESEVILAVRNMQSVSDGIRCVLDDGPARRIAKSLGISVIGTIGIINCLESHSLLPKAKTDAMKKKLGQSSFRIDKKRL